MRHLIAAPLLMGVGFMIGSQGVHYALAEPARPPVNKPAAPVQHAGARPPAAPAQHVSVPTPSRPQPRPQPQPARPAVQAPAQRPAIGQRPNIPTASPPVSRPVTPRPVNPAATPATPQPASRPTQLPGGFGNGTAKPAVPPSSPVSRPNINSNARPGVQPPRADVPNSRPGANFPNNPNTRPGQPPIGERPSIANNPNRPGSGRPTIQWPDRTNGPGERPGVGNRPGINQDGSHNTIVNRTNNSANINNINQRRNFANYSGYQSFGGYRPGIGSAINGWNSAWYGNYNNWHRSYYPWYNGSWSGNLFNNWGVGPVAWGMGMWGLNSLRYSFGYTPYYNPFYAGYGANVGVPMYDNYSQPLMNVAQALPESGQEPPPMPPTASQAFDAARDAFKRGDYKTALVQTEVALKDFPNDPVMHEFRALTLFAMGQYRQASAIVHSLLASGPGWDWTTMSSLYANPDTYGTQLAALEKEAAAKPEDPSMQFLLAYHFMTIGNAEAAKGALANAKKLLPNDPVIAQLSQAAGVAVAQTPPMDPPPATNVNLDITGAWTATRADGGKIAMNTTKEGAFTWSVTDKSGKKESSDGDFKLEDDLLILERKSGGALTGRITPLAENKFLFKVIGGDPGDPGLTFAK